MKKSRLKKYKWSNSEDEFLKEFYEYNTADFLASKLNLKTQIVRNRLSKLGLKKTQKFIDSEKFIKMDTPEACYIAGLIFADGYINKKRILTEINMVSEDMSKIVNLFQKFGHWNIRFCEKKGGKQQTVICTHDKIIYNFFCDMGYKEKSIIEPTKILNYIPEELKHYWFRGFCDGDGCWYISNKEYRFSIAGTLNYNWNEIVKLFQKLNIENISIIRIKTNTGNSSRISLRKHSYIKKFGNYVYENFEKERIGLSRKYEKFKLILNYNFSRKIK